MDDNLFDENENENENNTNTISKVNSVLSIVVQPELENTVNITSTSNVDNVASTSNAVNVTSTSNAGNVTSTSVAGNVASTSNAASVISTSNAEFKPKGILKISTGRPYESLLKQIWSGHKQSERRASCLEMYHKKNNQENSNDSKAVTDDNAGLLSTSNTLKSVKNVTFSDKIHDAKLKPSSSLPSITKYSYYQQSNSQNLHLTNTKKVDSYKETSINKVPIRITNPVQFEDSDTDGSSDDEIPFCD
ncbi:unnamed protein product [Rotaria sordida]|uniref:Uncharacterized protein n=1 Tax=Rotaria sordida TaxID=392033 RepID=A0A815E6A7_9BILA|nr:unnamed protein product [Rotaria sordida]CAF1308252.1 unnamed protein product [Rotaria sordida]